MSKCVFVNFLTGRTIQFNYKDPATTKIKDVLDYLITYHENDVVYIKHCMALVHRNKNHNVDATFEEANVQEYDYLTVVIRLKRE